jgi:hypothetical protein
LKKLITDWYGGYCFDGRTMILNPWSVVNCLSKGSLGNFWHNSGTPGFLRALVRERRREYGVFTPEYALPGFSALKDADDTGPLSVMLQTGYITARPDGTPGSPRLSLCYPNLEVKASLLPLLSRRGIEDLAKDLEEDRPARLKRKSKTACADFFAHDAERFARSFKSALSEFPDPLLSPDRRQYQILFFSVTAIAGYDRYLEPDEGEDICDIRIVSPTGELFIVETRYLKTDGVAGSCDDALKDDEPDKGDGAGKAGRAGKGGRAGKSGVRSETDRLLKKILKLIADRKPFLKYQGGGFRIWNTALVISGKTDVAVAFEEAPNRKQIKDSYES